MTKQELNENIKWNDYGIGHIDLLIPIFEKEVKFELFSEDHEKIGITDKMFETVNDVLQLPINSIEKLKDLLWEECNFSFTVSDYGCIPNEGETEKDAHFREFELYNKEDSFAKSYIKGIQIGYEIDKLNGRYAQIKIDSSTDNLISIIVKNGKIIDYDSDGTFLGWFENDEQFAHKKRFQIIEEYNQYTI